jgi:hypothetical protein
VVIGSIEDSYIQACATGLTVGITGANPATCLSIKNTWLRANTTVGASLTSLLDFHANIGVFENGPKGIAASACGGLLFTNCWWEALVLAGEFVNCTTVSFYGGTLEGGSTGTRAFYFSGASTPTTVIFDGPWTVLNMSAIFATADTGVTIYVRSAELGAYTWQAVNGGKVIFEYTLSNKATWDPANCPSLTKTASTTVTVTGAKFGDICEASFENSTTDPQLFMFKADCLADDVVTVSGFNIHTAAIDLSSGTLTVTVRKRPLNS